MKRRKPPVVPAGAAPLPAEPMTAPAPEQMTRRDIVAVCLYTVLLFLAMTVQTARMSLVLLVLALALSIGKTPLGRLRRCMSVPLAGLLAFALLHGFAAIASPFGGSAVRELYKFIAAFSLAVIWLTRFERKHIRGLLWGISVVLTLIAVLSISAASSGCLYSGFSALMNALGSGSSYAPVAQETWNGRINGIYNDANVTASLLGLGLMVSVYLLGIAEKRWHRAAAALAAGVSALVFFLSMSRGAILCLVLAVVVWLLAAGGEDRALLFLKQVVLALSTVLFAVPAARGIPAPVPVLLSLGAGLLFFALTEWLLPPLAARLQGKGKILAAVSAAVVVACVAAVVVALRVTGPFTFDQRGMVLRAVELSAGEYTVTAERDYGERVYLRAYVQSPEDALLGREEQLFEGELTDGTQTIVVPKDGTVWFYLWGKPGVTVQSVTLSDGTQVPLDYPLLPSSLADRMQGSLLSSGSFLMRWQYLKDGWKIFAQSPLTGHGLGSTEGLYTAVQPFYYQSLYAHNHILQVMDDMGLLGLAAFLALLLGAVWLLLRNLRTETGGLAALLLACWVMMNTHSLMEINFSVRGYTCVAFLLLLLPVQLYAKPLQDRVVKWGGWTAAGVLWLYLAVFGILLESHRMVEREAANFSTTSVTEFMNTLESYVRRDVFDHEQHQLSYVGNAVMLNDSAYNGNMRRYAEELRASGTYTACSGLSRYYYLPRGDFAELFACSREGIMQEASTKEAWNLQLNFYRNEVLPAAGEEHADEFAAGVLALRDMLTAYSVGWLEEIELTEENQAFLNAVVSAQEAGVTGSSLYLYLTQILGYGQAAN